MLVKNKFKSCDCAVKVATQSEKAVITGGGVGRATGQRQGERVSRS